MGAHPKTIEASNMVADRITDIIFDAIAGASREDIRKRIYHELMTSIDAYVMNTVHDTLINNPGIIDEALNPKK